MSKVVLPSDEYYSHIINRNKIVKEGFSLVYWSVVWGRQLSYYTDTSGILQLHCLLWPLFSHCG